jgi:hypothetical protein
MVAPNDAAYARETVLTDGEDGEARTIKFRPHFRRHGRTFRPPMLVRRVDPLAGRPRITIAPRPPASIMVRAGPA